MTAALCPCGKPACSIWAAIRRWRNRDYDAPPVNTPAAVGISRTLRRPAGLPLSVGRRSPRR